MRPRTVRKYLRLMGVTHRCTEYSLHHRWDSARVTPDLANSASGLAGGVPHLEGREPACIPAVLESSEKLTPEAHNLLGNWFLDVCAVFAFEHSLPITIHTGYWAGRFDRARIPELPAVDLQRLHHAQLYY